MKKTPKLPMILGILGALASMVTTTTNSAGETVMRGFAPIDVIFGFGIWFGIGLVIAAVYSKIKGRGAVAEVESESVA
jgi:hypothetical protein